MIMRGNMKIKIELTGNEVATIIKDHIKKTIPIETNDYRLVDGFYRAVEKEIIIDRPSYGYGDWIIEISDKEPEPADPEELDEPE